jgi:hypothetical protein
MIETSVSESDEPRDNSIDAINVGESNYVVQTSDDRTNIYETTTHRFAIPNQKPQRKDPLSK